ncbi:TnpV protein [Mediterraneibacter massiliensis]|uniref:TnpV protein n=1 Tax=Mediterraneibacter massiliensis TaxID=1720300 RepID=UPI0022E9755C|nr:TnpV protein [Mediterraneibacter massiliensis]
MKLTYTNVNGYLIPNLTYKSGEQMEHLSKYGFLRRDYLKNHRNSTYQVMLLQDTIGEHLLEVDKAARERDEVILKQLEEKEPLPDKEKDQMAWMIEILLMLFLLNLKGGWEHGTDFSCREN